MSFPLLISHEPGNQPAQLPLPAQKGLEVACHNAIEHALFRPARAILACEFAHGSAPAAEYNITPLRSYVYIGNIGQVRTDHAPRSSSCSSRGRNITNGHRVDLSEKFIHLRGIPASHFVRGDTTWQGIVRPRGPPASDCALSPEQPF
jgi:hypothetical protein